jgi:hypothetical protein
VDALGERSSLLTRIAATEGVSLCVRMKSCERAANLQENVRDQAANRLVYKRISFIAGRMRSRGA